MTASGRLGPALNLRVLKGLALLSGLQLYKPFLAIYLAQSLGGSSAHLGLLITAKATTQVLFEIPSGAIADLLGYKLTLLIATCLRIFATFVLFTAGRLEYFLLFACIEACADSMVSGTDEALIYDSLKALGREHEYKKHMAEISLFWPAAACLSSIISGALVAYTDVRTTVAFSALPLGLCFMLNLLVADPSSVKQSRPMSGVAQFLSQSSRHVLASIRVFLEDRTLVLLLCFGMGTYAFAETAYQFRAVFLQEHGIPLGQLGIWDAAMFALTTVGSLSAHRLSHLLGDKQLLMACVVVTSTSLLGASVTTTWMTGAFRCLGSVAWGVTWPVASHNVNSIASSDHRATVVSIMTLAKKLGLSLFAVAVAALIDMYGVTAATQICAVLLLSTCIPLWLLQHRHKPKQ